MISDSQLAEAVVSTRDTYPNNEENPPFRSPFRLRIAPSKGWVPLRLDEIWQYRELLYFLVWRDIKVRYKQTALGAAWAIVQPFMTMVVFSLFFGHLAKMQIGRAHV